MIQFIRKLSKSNKSLNLFSFSKEIYGIRLFHNEIDLTKIQTIYINYLYFYYGLHQDILMDKVSKDVLKNEIREDSYSLYKSKQEKKEETDNKKHDVHLKFSK